MTYIDTKGRSRLITSDELVFYTYNNGDYVLENESGKIYKNFSDEKRKEKIDISKKRSLENYESTYCIDDNNHSKDWACKGKRFCDFKTGEIYVIRFIDYKYYYINISNGFIIRKTDWQIKDDKLRKENGGYIKDNIDIDMFNIKQSKINNQQMLFRNFDYNYYCDIYK